MLKVHGGHSVGPTHTINQDSSSTSSSTSSVSSSGAMKDQQGTGFTFLNSNDTMAELRPHSPIGNGFFESSLLGLSLHESIRNFPSVNSGTNGVLGSTDCPPNDNSDLISSLNCSHMSLSGLAASLGATLSAPGQGSQSAMTSGFANGGSLLESAGAGNDMMNNGGGGGSPLSSSSSLVGGLASASSSTSSSCSSSAKCPLCHEQLKDPKVLPCCFSTFCLGCLERIKETIIRIKCPSCTNETYHNSASELNGPNQTELEFVNANYPAVQNALRFGNVRSNNNPIDGSRVGAQLNQGIGRTLNNATSGQSMYHNGINGFEPSRGSLSRQASLVNGRDTGHPGSNMPNRGSDRSYSCASLSDSISDFYEKWSMGGNATMANGVGTGGPGSLASGRGSPSREGMMTPTSQTNGPLSHTNGGLGLGGFSSGGSSNGGGSVIGGNNGFGLSDISDLSARLLSSSLSGGAPGLALGNGGSLPMKSQIKRQKMIYHCKFGEFGVMEGQFTEPSGVAVNAQNDIIVADTNNHRIQIFDREGRFKFQFGECGKRDGQLLYPNRVAVVRNSGDIVVTERSPTHQIQIYNQYGQFVRKFGANILQHPRGVTVDSRGRIIVVECKVMRVIIFDQQGNLLHKFGCSKHLEFPNGVVVNDRQEIFISDNRAHCVKVFSYEGVFLRQIGGEGLTNYPIGVCINDNQEILVADNHNNFNITCFTQDGTLIHALESKVKHAQCFDVALMHDNSVVLASKDYRIYIYRYLQLPGGAAVPSQNATNLLANGTGAATLQQLQC